MEPETCFGFLTVSALSPFRKQFTLSSFTYVQYLARRKMIPKHDHDDVATDDGDQDDSHHNDADDNIAPGDGNSSYLHPERFSHSSMHSFDDFWSVSNPPPPKN